MQLKRPKRNISEKGGHCFAFGIFSNHAFRLFDLWRHLHDLNKDGAHPTSCLADPI
jgi:hypothetical protein